MELCNQWAKDPEGTRVAVSHAPCGTRIIDCGVHASGGIQAGLHLAEVCLAGLGQVVVQAADANVAPWPWILTNTDHPLAACLASQYAGWQITGEKFFAMGSGPMRAAYGKEKLFDDIGFRERPPVAVGVLETSKLPPEEVCQKIAADCAVAPKDLTLVCARTGSIAGHVQIVARSVETALHKMHEIGFDLSRVHGGIGVAPLPPIAKDDLEGIGRTNDAVLYGGVVTIWVRGDDSYFRAMGPRIPANSSRDFGEPFSAVFERYGRDFYKIDPLLFSPAVVVLGNLDTGHSFMFGEPRPDVLKQSFNN